MYPVTSDRPRLPRCYVFGTQFDDRTKLVRKYCYETMLVDLRREPNNPHDPNAVSVWISVSGFFGHKKKQNGYLKRSHAERVSIPLDAGHSLWAQIDEIYDPPGRRYPNVRLNVGYDD